MAANCSGGMYRAHTERPRSSPKKTHHANPINAFAFVSRFRINEDTFKNDLRQVLFEFLNETG
jgi:hypothetical protein